MEPSRKKMRMTLRSESKKPPSQPLLKWPLLVQIEIIKTMTPSEQYLLSKCSRRSRHVVKASIPSKEPSREIWVHFHHYPSSLYWASYLHFYLKTGENTMLIHESREKFSPEEHEDICDLFKASPEVYASWEGAEPTSKDSIINGSIKRSNLLKYGWGSNFMKEYFEFHPNQELLLLHGAYLNSLERGHNFFGAKNFMFSSIKGCSPYTILSSFHGEHLLMEDVLICKFFIEVFVDKWTRQTNDRLKSVIFKLVPEAAIGILKYETFGGSDRKVQYDSPIKDYHKFPNGIFDCSQGYEVRRETDGKVATIKITNDYFMFLVW